jgi:hypothetical protein
VLVKNTFFICIVLGVKQKQFCGLWYFLLVKKNNLFAMLLVLSKNSCLTCSGLVIYEEKGHFK